MELLEKLEIEFSKAKAELGFKATLEELDSVLTIKDFIQDKGYVSTKIPRMLASRIVDLFMGWFGYLHSILLPNPNSILNITESQLFSDEEKKEIQIIINKILAMTSKNGIISLTKDKKQESEFIDNSLALWHEIKPGLIRILQKINKNWKEKSKGVEPEKTRNSLV